MLASGSGSDPQSFSVVMPFHNEAATLRPALERLLKTELPLELQVVLVDDGSTDGGLDTVEDLLDDDRVCVVSRPRRGGKGAALRDGLRVADGDIVGVLDADLEYDPADFEALLRVILAGDAEVVYGTRTFGSHLAAHSFWFVVGNRLTSLWASFLFDTWLVDIHTCLKVAPRHVWSSVRLRSRGFAIDPEVTARFLKAGHRIYEVPVSYRARTRAEGKKLRWTDGLSTVAVLAGVRLSRRGAQARAR